MKAPVGLLSRRPVCEANAVCLARQGHGDFDALEPGGDYSLLTPKENQKSASDFDALDPRERGCSPLSTPKRMAPYKKASRFAQTGCGAQRPLRALSGTRVLLTAAPTAPPCIRRWRRSSPLHFFLASPIDRPLSRCGGSSPQGSQRLQLPFAVTTPSREKENLKNPRLRSNESPSGAFKRQNGLALARWRSPAPTSSADFSNSQNKNNISAEDAQSETGGHFKSSGG